MRPAQQWTTHGDCCALLVTLTKSRRASLKSPVVPPLDPIRPGMICLLISVESARTLELHQTEYALITLPVSWLNARSISQKANFRSLVALRTAVFTRPCYEAEQLARLALRLERFHPTYARGLLENISDALLACLFHDHEFGRDNPAREFGAQMFHRVCTFAEEKLPDVLNLEEWASSVGMKSREFARRFRATAGCSPYAWLMQRRIERAKDLLQSGGSNLCDVAFSVGFYSQSHFTDAFRKREGMSPGRWLQQHSTRRTSTG